MSSSHIVVVARNFETGEVEVALKDMTLYDEHGKETLLELIRAKYSEDWGVALYKPITQFYCGSKPKD